MRKIKEVLRLKWGHQFSDRKIAKSCQVSRPAVADYVRRAKHAGLSWPLPGNVDDAALEKLLFPASCQSTQIKRSLPDWLWVYQELKKKNVTLFLLWQEYREQQTNGYQYSWFCDQFRSWLGQRDVSMRQTHRAGEKLFVDYAGQTVPVVDARTGEIRSAEIFVAVLGASNYTYAEATWTQALPDWIGAHQRTFEFLGGVVEIVVPDNLRSGDWSAQRFTQWAQKIGPATVQVITAVFSDRRHTEQGFRSCLGILRLAKTYSDQRLEAACQRALLLGTHRYKSIESILKHGLDEKPVAQEDESTLPQKHENVRGSDYYH